VRERNCSLVAVLGTAGVGKSRLAREFVHGVRSEARVVGGRCLSYGDGITFWPVAEMVREACGITGTDPRIVARSKIDVTLSGTDEAELIADRVAAVSGFGESSAGMQEDQGFLGYEDGRWRVLGDLSKVSVPATIQALLAARLDRLTPEEKAILGCAAVIGKVFWWGAVSELSPEPVGPGVGAHLQT